jgi:hypothetical protein
MSSTVTQEIRSELRWDDYKRILIQTMLGVMQRCAAAKDWVLKQILIDLSKKTKWCVWRVYTEKNEKLRANIDVLDATLLELLGKRMKVADEIGVVKKAANVALQNNCWTKLGKMILMEKPKDFQKSLF